MKIKPGQTWRNGYGQIVHVTEAKRRTRHIVIRDDELMGYSVDADGRVDHRNNETTLDLVSQVPRVYIAGPMSGYDDLNFPAFHAAAKLYRDRGCFVINPAEMNGGEDEASMCKKMTVMQLADHWQACMRKDIAALVTCEMIVMLPMWQMSKGATLEHHIAQALGLTVTHLDK